MFLFGNSQNHLQPLNTWKTHPTSHPIGQLIISYLFLATERPGISLSVCSVSLSTFFVQRSANQRPCVLFPVVRITLHRFTRARSIPHRTSSHIMATGSTAAVLGLFLLSKDVVVIASSLTANSTGIPNYGRTPRRGRGRFKPKKEEEWPGQVLL